MMKKTWHGFSINRFNIAGGAAFSKKHANFDQSFFTAIVFYFVSTEFVRGLMPRFENVEISENPLATTDIVVL